MIDDLKDRQAAAKRVEERLLEFLLQFDPVARLSIGDAKLIAECARNFSFDAFSPKQ